MQYLFLEDDIARADTIHLFHLIHGNCIRFPCIRLLDTFRLRPCLHVSVCVLLISIKYVRNEMRTELLKTYSLILKSFLVMLLFVILKAVVETD